MSDVCVCSGQSHSPLCPFAQKSSEGAPFYLNITDPPKSAESGPVYLPPDDNPVKRGTNFPKTLGVPRAYGSPAKLNNDLLNECAKWLEKWTGVSTGAIALAIFVSDQIGKKVISPDEQLLRENKCLIEAGDALYERASYTGRNFDGTHRLLSAAADWLDIRGKMSSKYQNNVEEEKC